MPKYYVRRDLFIQIRAEIEMMLCDKHPPLYGRNGGLLVAGVEVFPR